MYLIFTRSLIFVVGYMAIMFRGIHEKSCWRLISNDKKHKLTMTGTANNVSKLFQETM